MRGVSRVGVEREIERATAWLRGLIDVERRPDWPYRRFSLDPIRALLARLGNPERALPAVHIAGSKGKGSTALLAEAILLGAGRRVGTFTSPHLERWTERFRIDGVELEEARLAQAIAEIRPHVDQMRHESPELAPTFFDATTAIAFQVFRAAALDCAVLEVGLGGRLDSTNACVPAVSCVTSIELEHTDRLGHTHAAIAAEKAGILRPGVPVVVGALSDEALAVVLRRAAEIGAPVSRFGVDFGSDLLGADLEGSRIRVWDGPLELQARLSLLGAPCVQNAALATACARRFLGDALPAERFAAMAASALSGASLPGRIEVVSRRPLVIVDAAHTAESARALAAVLAEIEQPLHLVLSISEDKDVDAILGSLLPHASWVTATRAEPARSLDADALALRARTIAPTVPTRAEPDPHRAVREARTRCAKGEALCVSGSVYLAGIARAELCQAIA